MNSFDLSVKHLFERIMLISVLISSILVLYYLYYGELDQLLPNAFFLITCTGSWFLSKIGRHHLAYHLTLLLTFSINLLFFFVVKTPFYSIVMMGSTMTIYTLVFFKSLRIQRFYLVIILGIEFLMFHQAMRLDGLNISSEFWPEYIAGFFHIAIVYMVGQYFISRLRNSNNELDSMKAEYFNQNEHLKAQNQRLDQYIESNHKLENFAYLASHELKSPLRIVKSFADLVYKKRQDLTDDQIDEYLEMVSSNSEKMTHLVDALQDMGGVAKAKLEKVHIPLNAFIQTIVYERKLDAEDAIVELHIEPSTIYGDQRMLHRLFSNLLGNALKFVAPHQLKPHVKIHCFNDETYFHFTICDNGIGIAPQKREEVFELFNRQTTYSEYEGLGIGLALSKQIVDVHNGIIEIQDSLLGGVCFKVSIPNS